MYEISLLQPLINREKQSVTLISEEILNPNGKGYLTKTEFSNHLNKFSEITVNNVEKCNTFSIGPSGFRGQYGDCSRTPFDPLFVVNLEKKIPKRIDMRLYGDFTAANTMTYFSITWKYTILKTFGTEDIVTHIYQLADGQYSSKYAYEYKYYNVSTNSWTLSRTITSLSNSNLIELDILSNMNPNSEIYNSRIEFYQSNTYNTYSQTYGAVYISYLKINY